MAIVTKVTRVRISRRQKTPTSRKGREKWGTLRAYSALAFNSVVVLDEADSTGVLTVA
jgi:hypothetical protein